MSLHIFSILTFKDTNRGSRLGCVPTDVSGALLRRQQSIDDFLIAISFFCSFVLFFLVCGDVTGKECN